MGECYIFVQIDFYSSNWLSSHGPINVYVALYDQLAATYLGSGKIIFLLALAAGVHLDFSIAMR